MLLKQIFEVLTVPRFSLKYVIRLCVEAAYFELKLSLTNVMFVRMVGKQAAQTLHALKT